MVKKHTPVAILLSGGMDSTTLLADLIKGFYIKNPSTKNRGKIHPIFINYGQKHLKAEHKAALDIVEEFYVAWRAKNIQPLTTLKLDLKQIGGSALTSKNIKVPDNMEEQINTVVPYRNALISTLAASWCLVNGVSTLYMAPVADDFNSYRDCRLPFFDALNNMFSQGSTHAGTHVTIQTPYANIWKYDIIKQGLKAKVPYMLTHSCYKGKNPPCGTCPACVEREQAFKNNGAVDPLISGPYSRT